MRLAFDELAKPAIKRLESLSDNDLHEVQLIGRCVRVEGRLRIQPFGIIRHGQPDSLFFGDAKPASVAASSVPISSADNEVIETEAEQTAPVHSSIGKLGYAAVSSLECFAESGLRARNGDARQRLDELARQARHLGLIRLEGLLANSTSAASWLRVRWILSLMERAAGAVRTHAEQLHAASATHV
jgi:hypothetical protein